MSDLAQKNNQPALAVGLAIVVQPCKRDRVIFLYVFSLYNLVTSLFIDILRKGKQQQQQQHAEELSRWTVSKTHRRG